MPLSLRESIALARTSGHLVEVGSSTDPHLEMARVAYGYDGRPVLFEDVSGYPAWRVLAGVAPGARRRSGNNDHRVSGRAAGV